MSGVSFFWVVLGVVMFIWVFGFLWGCCGRCLGGGLSGGLGGGLSWGLGGCLGGGGCVFIIFGCYGYRFGVVGVDFSIYVLLIYVVVKVFI